MMNAPAVMPIEPFLKLTDDALSLLEQALVHEHRHEHSDGDDLNAIFRAIDALGFAVLRYRQRRCPDQPDDDIPY